MEHPNMSGDSGGPLDMNRKSELEEIREKRLAYFGAVVKTNVTDEQVNNVSDTIPKVTDEVAERLFTDAHPYSKPEADAPNNSGDCGTCNEGDTPSNSHVYKYKREEEHVLRDNMTCTPELESALSKNGYERQLMSTRQYHDHGYDGYSGMRESPSTPLNHNIRSGGSLDSELRTSNPTLSESKEMSSANQNIPTSMKAAPEQAVHYDPSVSYMPERIRHEDDQRFYHNTPQHQAPFQSSTRDRWNSDQVPPQHRSLRESIDLDNKTFIMFDNQSTADIAQLGLSTHRPSSERTLTGDTHITKVTDLGMLGGEMTSAQTNQKPWSDENLHDEFRDQDLKDLLGEEKYKEFLAKSLKDIEALKQERQACQVPGITAGKQSQLDDPAIVAIGSSMSEKLVRKLAAEDERSFQTWYGKGQECQPKLNRPKESPSLVQNSVTKTRGDLDREIPQVQQRYGMRNYEQITVPRKATFSSDEIYHQAFGPGTLYQQQHMNMMDTRGQPLFYNNNNMQLPYQYPVPSAFGSVASHPDMPDNLYPSYIYEQFPPPPTLMYSPHPPQNSSPRRTSQHGQGPVVRPQQPTWMPLTPRDPMTHGYIPHPPPGQHLPFYPTSTIPAQMLPPPHQVNVHVGVQYPVPQSPVLPGNDVTSCVPAPPWPTTFKSGPIPPNHTDHPIHSRHSQDLRVSCMTEQHGGHKVGPSQQHIDGVRLYHENRRSGGVKSDGQVLDAGQQSAVDRLEKYFSSIEDLYKDREGQNQQTSYTDELNGRTDLTDKFELTELDTTMDDELETLVASTIANLKVGGVTERLRDLGIDIPFLTAPREDQQGDTRSEKMEGSAPDAPLSPKSKVAKVCPECSSLNKPYMSWCASCGEVIIGVEAVKVKSKKHRGKKSSLREREGWKQPEAGQNFVHFSAENDAGSEYPVRDDRFLDGCNEVMDEKRFMQTSTKFPPEPQENIDSGRGPSSGEERQMSALTGRTEREITEICQLIDDPIVRGFIKSYLKKKRNDPSPGFHQSLHRTVEGPIAGGSVSRPAKAVSVDPMKNEDVWFHEAEGQSRKGKNKPVLSHGKDEDIDIEVFPKEEVSDRPSVTRNGLEIPLLDLGNSSDEEQNKKPCRELELTFSDDEDDIQVTDGVFQEAGQGDAARNTQNGMPGNLLADSRVKSAPSARTRQTSQTSPVHHVQCPNSASRLVGNTSKQPRSPGKRVITSADRHVRPPKSGEVKGQVRKSIEVEPHQRHWMRSSIAWSSYNHGELQEERSMPPSQWRPDVKGRRPPTDQDEVSSPDSEEYYDQKGSGTSGRPASADMRRRKTKLQERASSAGTRKKNSWEGQRDINLKSRTTDLRKVCGDVKRRPAVCNDQVMLNTQPDQSDYVPMPVPKVTDTLLTPSTTLQANSSVQSAYDRYHEMTPRIHNGSFSVWLCLPEEILLHILSHLSITDLYRCALACKHFYRVAMDQTLWNSITLKKCYNICDDWLEEIGKRHPRRLCLIQCHGDNASSDGLQRMFQHCGQYLEELNFSSCSRGALVGDSILLQASIACKQLTHLDMSWSFVTDNGLCSISTTAHRLSSVCMNGCQSVSNHGLEHLLRKHGKSLRALELFGCFNINNKGIRSIGTHCHNLRTLNLGQCYKVTDSCIAEVSGLLPRLESLDLRGCKQIKDSCIRKIVKNCPRVSSLALANCPHISDTGLNEIATYLSHIRWIDLCGCRRITDESLRALSKNCQNLRYIDISSTGCTRKSVLVLATFCCDRLEVVKLNFLTDIDEPSVLRLISNCKRLNTLQLYGCKGIRLTKEKLQQDYPQLTVEMG